MDPFTNHFDPSTGDSSGTERTIRGLMNPSIAILMKLGILKEDLDYHLIRATMVILFLFFGYQKWWEYEAQALIPYISNGPLIFWLYPVFGIRGATWFLGGSEWTFGALLFLGFWKEVGNSRRHRFMHYFYRHHHDHSIYAEWLGCVRRRLPGDDGPCRFSNERYRSVFRITLFA